MPEPTGVARRNTLRPHELKSIYERAPHMPFSILGLVITGEDVHETGLIWPTADGDLWAWPAPGTLVPLYGTSPRPAADGDVTSRAANVV